MIETKNLVPVTTKKGLDRSSEGQPKTTKRVGSLLKRFMARVTKERDANCSGGSGVDAVVGGQRRHSHSHSHSHSRHMLWRKQHRQRHNNHSNRSLLLQLDSRERMPEILKVSPMSTSCEVTLISSIDDGSGMHQITVTHDGKSVEIDDSYHMILNPHRGTSQSNNSLFDDFDDGKDNDDFGNDFGSSEGGTHDLTTDQTTTAGLDDKNDSIFHNHEETIYFVETDERFIRDRDDVISRKDSIFYKSLFVASDTEDEDADGYDDEDNMQFWENVQSWRQEVEEVDNNDNDNIIANITYDHPCYASKIWAHLQKQQHALNTTLDTMLLEDDDDDDDSDDERDENIPIEITVELQNPLTDRP